MQSIMKNAEIHKGTLLSFCMAALAVAAALHSAVFSTPIFTASFCLTNAAVAEAHHKAKWTIILLMIEWATSLRLEHTLALING